MACVLQRNEINAQAAAAIPSDQQVGTGWCACNTWVALPPTSIPCPCLQNAPLSGVQSADSWLMCMDVVPLSCLPAWQVPMSTCQQQAFELALAALKRREAEYKVTLQTEMQQRVAKIERKAKGQVARVEEKLAARQRELEWREAEHQEALQRAQKEAQHKGQQLAELQQAMAAMLQQLGAPSDPQASVQQQAGSLREHVTALQHERAAARV